MVQLGFIFGGGCLQGSTQVTRCPICDRYCAITDEYVEFASHFKGGCKLQHSNQQKDAPSMSIILHSLKYNFSFLFIATNKQQLLHIKIYLFFCPLSLT